MEFLDPLKIQPLRAWLKVDETTVPAIAKSPDIVITSDRVSLAFIGGGAELYAISIGKKYQVERSPVTYTEAEVYLHGVQGQLSLIGKSGEIAAQNESSSAIAYLPAKGEAQGISIVSQLSGNGQVVVKEGGIIESSPDLSGRHIKFAQFPLIHPPAVAVTQEAFKQLTVNLTYTQENLFYLAQIPANLIPSSQHIEQERRRIELVYLRDRVTVQEL